MCFDVLLEHALASLQEFEEPGAPFEKIKIQALRNRVLLRQGSLSACYSCCQALLAFCRSQGFAKTEYIDCLLMVVEVLVQNELLFDGLIKV
jgi:hypothetical protein